MDIPVVFLVFNRPELTARVFARIREARPGKLFVVADGPRPDRPGEAEKCRQVRELIERGVDWPCEVIRDYSGVNLGCGKRVASGITHAFEVFEEAIILEDDCLPDPTFFPFCAELLERYRDESSIGQIGGCTFRTEPPRDGASYYFSAYPHCWGWATWRRAWRLYEREISRELSHAVIERFPSRAERRYWSYAFEATASGKVDTWDYCWTASLWASGCLSVLPAVNLVHNIGFGADATHTLEGSAPPSCAIAWPLCLPAKLVRDAGADASVGAERFQRRTLFGRLLRRLGRYLN